METEGGNDMTINIKRGDIAMANLTGEYSAQSGYRPVLIMQNDIGNKYSPTTIIVPLTSEIKKENMPTHEVIKTDDATGLKCNSMVLCEQLTTIDKRKLNNIVGKVNNQTVMNNISRACACAIALG